MAPTGDYNVRADCLVTDFGVVRLPNSWLLHHFVKKADEFSEYLGSQPAFLRILMKDVRNSYRDTLEEYYKYVGGNVELGYGYGKANWQVSFLSFHDWLRQKENVHFAYKAGTGPSPSGQGSGDS